MIDVELNNLLYMSEYFLAIDRAGSHQETFVAVGTMFEANTKTAKVVGREVSLFDNPAKSAQAITVIGAVPCNVADARVRRYHADRHAAGAAGISRRGVLRSGSRACATFVRALHFRLPESPRVFHVFQPHSTQRYPSTCRAFNSCIASAGHRAKQASAQGWQGSGSWGQFTLFAPCFTGILK
ncbi:hypothetical protein ACFPTO_20750 [Paraburkholderia denitrificans]|uniref:Uncharacterized protein n=1 Tax=Paraburkholderia denitrificans TaxID=694025 RepID=A0ABW0JE95_9BURK